MNKFQFVILFLLSLAILIAIAAMGMVQEAEGAPAEQCWDNWQNRYVYAKYSHTFPIEGYYMIRTVTTVTVNGEYEWMDFGTKDLFVWVGQKCNGFVLSPRLVDTILSLTFNQSPATRWSLMCACL